MCRSNAPAYNNLRAQSSDSLPFQHGIRAVMDCKDQKAVASFVYQLRKACYEAAYDDCVEGVACAGIVDGVTRGTDDHANLLLCDGACCRAFHRYCVANPPNRSDGCNLAWVCPECTEARMRPYHY